MNKGYFLHLQRTFHLQIFFASVKVLFCRYLFSIPLSSFAQNRGKFAPNHLALQLLHLLCKAAHKGKQGGTGWCFCPTYAINRNICFFNSFSTSSQQFIILLTPFVNRVYIPQAALPTLVNRWFLFMDIFQHFLSHQSENTSAFSDIFRTAKEFHQLLGQKNYLLNHYLSMFFRLITEMDFCALEDEIE